MKNYYRFIIQCYGSNPDSYGRCNYYGKVTSIKSGSVFYVRIEDESQLRSAMAKAIEGFKNCKDKWESMDCI